MAKQKTIDDYKADWEAANAIGDKEGMRAAHEGAEAIRAQYGYSGGSTGDEFINTGSDTNRFIGNTGALKDANTGAMVTTDSMKRDAASSLAKGSTQTANAILSFLTTNYGSDVAAGDYNISKNDRGAEVPEEWLTRGSEGPGSISLPAYDTKNGWNRNEILFTDDLGNRYAFANGEIYNIGQNNNLPSGLSEEELLRRAIETGQVDTSTWGNDKSAPAGGSAPSAKKAGGSSAGIPGNTPGYITGYYDKNGYPINGGNYPSSGWEPYMNDTLAELQKILSAPPEFNYQGSEWDAIRDSLARQYVNQNYSDWVQGDEYAALRDRIAAQGRTAMQDTLGQVSARTGGLASSYASTAAQQAMNNYMANLEPQARQEFAQLMNTILGQWNTAGSMADLDYNRYVDKYGYDRQNWADTAEGLNTMYGLYADRDNQAYNRFRDDQAYETEMMRWQADQDWQQKQFDYDADWRQKNFDYDSEWKTKQWEQSLLEYQDSKDADARKDAQEQINMILMSGGSLSDIPADLITQSGWGTSTLAAAERTAQQAIADAQAKKSGGGSSRRSGSGSGSGGGTDWSDVEAWVDKYGADAAESYIAEHYTDLGYSNKSKALAGWQNHLRELENAEDEREYTISYTNTHDYDAGWMNVDGIRFATSELLDYIEQGLATSTRNSDGTYTIRLTDKGKKRFSAAEREG